MDAPPADPAGELRFRADRVEVTPSSVLLEGGVRLSAGRLRVDAPRLRWRRGDDGTHELEGPLRLRPCPCEGPLVLEVDRARVALREGAFDQAWLRGVTVRLGPAPVLWTPWLWLRSERRWGLLPPRLAYRASDGLLAGAGAHAPLGPGAWLQLEPAFYLRGGHDVLGRVRYPEGSLGLRWDRRGGQDLLAAQGQGLARPAEGLVAWSIDARRGERARRATIEIEEAARGHDRARAALLLPAGGGLLATGVRASAARGQGPWIVGPQTTWSASARSAGASAWLDAAALAREGGRLTTALTGQADASHAWWRGPLRLVPSARSLGLVALGPEGAQAEASALAGLRLDAPLERPLGSLTHGLTPGLWLGALASGSRGQALAAGDATGASGPASAADPWLVPLAPRGLGALGAVRLESTLAGKSGALLVARLTGGALLAHDGAKPAGRAALLAESEAAQVTLEGSATRADDAMALGQVALGREGKTRLLARVEGQRGQAPVLVRALEGALPWGAGRFDQAGWSADGGIELALGASVRAVALGWASLSQPRWLGERVSLLLSHPCGCLHLGAHTAQRLGRPGLDAWLSLSLAAP